MIEIILTVSIASKIMRAHRAVRAAALTETPLFRNCASRPRFLCLNASRQAGVGGARGRIPGGQSQRWFSETRLVRAGAAEAVYVLLFL
jgi:elongation factor G